jgi:hypothetical protein
MPVRRVLKRVLLVALLGLLFAGIVLGLVLRVNLRIGMTQNACTGVMLHTGRIVGDRVREHGAFTEEDREDLRTYLRRLDMGGMARRTSAGGLADLWKNPFSVVIEFQPGSVRVTAASAGPDGLRGTADDILTEVVLNIEHNQAGTTFMLRTN